MSQNLSSAAVVIGALRVNLISFLFIPDKQGIPNASPCEEDQRLGSTIAVNRNFEQVMHLDDPVSMVTVGSETNGHPVNI